MCEKHHLVLFNFRKGVMLAQLPDLARSIEEEPLKLGISALKMQRLLGPAHSNSTAVAAQEILAVWIPAQRFESLPAREGGSISIGRGCLSEMLHALLFRRGFLMLMDKITSTLCFCCVKETFWSKRDPDSESLVPQEY